MQSDAHHGKIPLQFGAMAHCRQLRIIVESGLHVDDPINQSSTQEYKKPCIPIHRQLSYTKKIYIAYIYLHGAATRESLIGTPWPMLLWLELQLSPHRA